VHDASERKFIAARCTRKVRWNGDFPVMALRAKNFSEMCRTALAMFRCSP
jgi:hypothetical protein